MPYNINLKHLECFIKVAQLGSINNELPHLVRTVKKEPLVGKIEF